MPRTEEVNQRIREERRRHILDAAIPVFTHKGLAGTKIADIAAASEISQGLIYRYFENKEEIFAALVERAMYGTIRLAREALTQPGSPLERLRWLLHEFITGLQENPSHGLLILQALTSESVPKELREQAIGQSRVLNDTIKQLVSEGQASGEVMAGDPETLTLMVLACVGGLTTNLLGGTGLPPATMPDPELILRMIKA